MVAKLESITPEQRADYVTCVGANGLEGPDDRLRGLERASAAQPRALRPSTD